MKRNTKILIIVLSVIVLLGLVTIALIGWYVARNADGWIDRGRARVEEGRKAGASLDSVGCVDRAIGEYRGKVNPISAISQRIWLTGCLQTAEQNVEVCPKIEAESTLGAVAELLAARNAFCAKHGLAADQGCQQLAEAVEQFCFPSDASQAAPADATAGEP